MQSNATKVACLFPASQRVQIARIIVLYLLIRIETMQLGRGLAMKSLYATSFTRRTMPYMVTTLFAVLLVSSFVAIATAEDLRTAKADASEVEGTFTLMLYGCNNESDVNNIAILQREGDVRSFNIEGQSSDVQVKAGLSGEAALVEADKFLECRSEFDHTQLAKIVDSEGSILGFEVKPHYLMEKYGMPDAFMTRYVITGDAIDAWITPSPFVEMPSSGD
jgi:hypothetical protein